MSGQMITPEQLTKIEFKWRESRREENDWIFLNYIYELRDANTEPEDECAVTDNKGNHCPEKPSHTIFRNGEQLELCERCYLNVMKGAYGDTTNTEPEDEWDAEVEVVADYDADAGHEAQYFETVEDYETQITKRKIEEYLGCKPVKGYKVWNFWNWLQSEDK